MLDLLEHLRKEWTVIEGAPISFVIAVAICFLIVSLLYRQRFALLRDEVADYRYALEAVAPAQLASRIRISTPQPRAHLTRQFIVSGTAKPIGSAVQVLLLAGDGRWHPQEKPVFSGTGWYTRCWAGAEDAQVGSMFRIVAVDGSRPITEPVTELPSGIARSKEVVVYRAA